MTGGNGQAAEPAQRGRYALYPQDKGVIIAHTTDLCETCLACGCGTPQEPIDLTPSGVGGMLGKLGKLKGMVRL